MPNGCSHQGEESSESEKEPAVVEDAPSSSSVNCDPDDPTSICVSGEILKTMGVLPAFGNRENRVYLNELVSLMRSFCDLNVNVTDTHNGGITDADSDSVALLSSESDPQGQGRGQGQGRSSSHLFLFYAVDKLVLHPTFVDIRKNFYDFVEVRSLRFEGLSRIEISADEMADDDDFEEEEEEEEGEFDEEEEEGGGGDSLRKFRSKAKEDAFKRLQFFRYVNRFVEKLTDGVTKNFLSRKFLGTLNLESVEGSYLLCSTVSFRRKWRVGFDSRDTLHDVKFSPLQEMIDATTMVSPKKKKNAGVVLVEMMSASNYTALTAEHDWKGVKFSSLCMPFDDSRFVFVLLLPENAGVKQMNNVVEIAKTQGCFDRIRSEQRLSTIKTLQLPRFSVGTSCQLKSTLEKMGARSMFSPEDADFYRMATTGHHVVDVVQRTEFFVSEDGLTVRKGDPVGGGDLLRPEAAAVASVRVSTPRTPRTNGSGRRTSRRGRGRSSSGRRRGSARRSSRRGASRTASPRVTQQPEPPGLKRTDVPEVQSFCVSSPFLAFVASASFRVPLLYAKILKPRIAIDED